MFKKLNRLFFITAYSLIFAASVGAGVKYVITKNKQTLVQREIDEVEKRIVKNTNLLNQYKSELQNSNNRFILKQQLAEMNTGLEPISSQKIVTVQSVKSQQLADSQ